MAWNVDGEDRPPKVVEMPQKRKFFEWVNIEKWFCEDPPPEKYIFDGTLLQGVVGGIIAQGGGGKSMLSLYMCISAATGLPFFRAFRPVKPFKVLVLFGEDAEEQVWRRFRKAIKSYGLTDEKKHLLKENLKVMCGRGEPLLEWKTDKRGRLGQIGPSSIYNDLKKEIKDFQPDLVIIDPKSMWCGLEENENHINTIFINALYGLSRVNGATVLFTHHVNKGGAHVLELISSRGGGALVDGGRWIAIMRNGKHSETLKTRYGVNETESKKYIELSIEKNSYAARLPDSVFFKFEDDGTLTQAALTENNQQQKIAEALKEVLANDENLKLSRDEIANRPAGSIVRDLLREKLESIEVKNKDIERAILYGLKEGILRKVETAGYRNVMKEVIRPAENSIF